MKISEKLISAFRETYRRKFSQDISNEEAEQDLSNLAELVRLTAAERNNVYEK